MLRYIRFVGLQLSVHHGCLNILPFESCTMNAIARIELEHVTQWLNWLSPPYSNCFKLLRKSEQA